MPSHSRVKTVVVVLGTFVLCLGLLSPLHLAAFGASDRAESIVTDDAVDPVPSRSNETADADSPAQPRNGVTADAAAGATCCGDVNETGDITSADVIYMVNYVFKGGAAPNCPGAVVAYGSVASDGTIVNAGSGNWTATYTGARYEITVSGESIFFNSSHASIMVYGNTTRFVTTGSTSGRLTVYIKDIAGTDVQDDFGFTIIQF